MAQRGPDGAGDWLSPDRRVGLAHRRLAIIDLTDKGAQPMSLGDGASPDVVITFNGEIYNYRELRQTLIERGRVFRTNSDTEVLLHLYKEFGAEMVHQLRGMFAFALWDATERRLVLARDPFGIKPLYYADDGRTIKVASQVKAFLADPAISRAPAPAGHVGFFVWGYVPDPYTLFRDIRSLPAGTILILEQGGSRTERVYFSATRVLALAESGLHASTTPDRQARLREALYRSVADHLVADTPVGLFLSAGIDSTSLAVAMSHVSSDPALAVTLGFPELQDTADDEVPLAQRTAHALGIPHRISRVSAGEFNAALDPLLEAMDQPTIDGVNTYFVSKAAREAGLKVALSGVGADEILAGYPSFHQIPRLVSAIRPLSVPRGMATAFRFVAARCLRNRLSPKFASLFEFGGSYEGAYLLRRGLFMPWELPDFIDPEVVRIGWGELQALPTIARLHEHLQNGRTKVMACELNLYMRDQLLRQTDWAGMAHSLEIRVPLVDAQLFGTLAPDLASANPLTKMDLADACESRFPGWVRDRPKTGFNIPVAKWMAPAVDGTPGSLRSWARHVHAHAVSTGRCDLALISSRKSPASGVAA